MALSRPSGSRTRLAVLVLASLTLLTVGLRDVPIVRDAREAASTVTDPVVGVVGAVTRPVGNVWSALTGDDPGGEEAELRERIAELEAEAVAGSDAETQLAELSRAVDLPYVGDVPTVAARVMSGPRSNFSHTVEIDKGGDDGVSVGMPVVTGAGLVGRVSKASGGTATVELISDPEYRVGVRLAGSGDLGTAEGRGRDEPLIVDTGIDPDTEVPAGEGLVTSGVDRSAYPAGIPVGQVAETRDGSGGLALELVVDPLVEVDNLSYVSVLLWEPGT